MTGLVRLLDEEYEEAQESAAYALNNLAVNAENAVAIGRANGAVTGLVRLLSECGADTACGI